MKVVIDRFEGEFAVVELPDGAMSNLPKSLIPSAKEGDIVVIEVDCEETQKRRERIEKLADEVWDD